jgi:hypothetical protein
MVEGDGKGGLTENVAAYVMTRYLIPSAVEE